MEKMKYLENKRLRIPWDMLTFISIVAFLCLCLFAVTTKEQNIQQQDYPSQIRMVQPAKIYISEDYEQGSSLYPYRKMLKAMSIYEETINLSPKILNEIQEIIFKEKEVIKKLNSEKNTNDTVRLNQAKKTLSIFEALEKGLLAQIELHNKNVAELITVATSR